MKIAAHVGIKDEVELIERTLAHLRAIGVDHIIACDTYSTDGTAEILEQHRGEDGFWLVRVDNEEPESLERVWLSQAVELAKKSAADWVIFLDADEYWLPKDGSLKHCASLQNADVLSVDRYNVVLGAHGPLLPPDLGPAGYGELLMFVEPIRDLRVHLEQNPGAAWIQGVPTPKVMTRPPVLGSLSHGMHDVIADGDATPRRAKPADIVIAHLPFTTPQRFDRKVENLSRVMAVHDAYFAGHMAWHWRRWARLAAEGRIRDEFQRMVLDEAQVAELRTRGVIRSAADVFRDREAAAGNSA